MLFTDTPKNRRYEEAAAQYDMESFEAGTYLWGIACKRNEIIDYIDTNSPIVFADVEAGWDWIEETFKKDMQSTG